MSLTRVSLLFLLQLGFGSLITFAVTDRRALGPKYDKFGGWVLLALYGLALTLVGGSALADAGSEDRPLAFAVLATTLATLLFASASGWNRPGLETLLLWIAILAGGVAVALGTLSATHVPLALASALGSALVLGFTVWGMILGHWYLVSQGLPVSHLARLVRPLPWMLLAKAAISGLALWWLWDQFLGPGQRSLSDIVQRSPDRILDVVNVWARIPLGLLVPMLLAFMTRVTVRMERTQPATGILYAMTVLVILGELFGKMVEGSTGVPL